jgi:Putative inner membrane protein (DUF1819)
LSVASSQTRKYALSFTAGGLLCREAALLAPLRSELGTWGEVRAAAVARNVLQARVRATAVRLVGETAGRLAALAAPELWLLGVGVTGSERAHLMWAAACRRYEFIGDFAQDVLAERFSLYQPLRSPDFDSFARYQAVWHEEVGAVAPSTLRRLRSNLFAMMREADLLAADGEILPAVLSGAVASALEEAGDLRFFPLRPSAL